ncbi:MAG TPA: 2-oxoacid:acceptor oxidoreductase subunit alpha, partial [Gammaproteobacteria bacterium]|nr:2-oxoacid:acceptor oxidoreductase subunit alpha [Gammaproteobacteria bacterium]
VQRAGLTQNPLENAKLQFRVLAVPLSTLVFRTLASTTLSRAKQRKCKNFFALGLVFWLYQRPMETTKKWIESKFKHQEDILQGNLLALEAGYRYAENSEMLEEQPNIAKASLPQGTYRQITGNEALALGALLAQQQTGRSLLVAGYPITPASDILQWFAQHGIKTFQAEDEIAAIGAALGASFGGSLALTTTSGPGMDLKSEMLGLAVMVELPLVVIDVQRAGPSTGMPTKVEQSDLWMALYGRHGECPVPVIAASTPADCFHTILEVFKIAVTYMTPVILLSDAYLANGAQPWLIPNLEELPKIATSIIPRITDFKPYKRNDNLARSWTTPGMEGYEHRIGGLEKTDITGEISYDPVNHEKMVLLRKQKIENIAQNYSPTTIMGALEGSCLVIGWGSTYGFILTAIQELQESNVSVSYVHLRHLYPLPLDLKPILSRFEKILVIEMNSGQLRSILRAAYLLDIKGLNKIKGQPFTVTEIKQGILALLGDV